DGLGARAGFAGSSRGAFKTIDQTTRATVRITMKMNSEKTRSGQVKILSSTSVFSKVGSPRARSSSFRVALLIESQTKKPTRKTNMSVGALSRLADTHR